MSWFELLQQSINYIENHLLEKINYKDIAENVHMSCYNFHRTFSLMAGITANEYIRNRRLSLAGQELQMTGNKVIDVAYKYGYETPESFAKAFTRFHGVSPKQARIAGTQLCLFNPLVIKITLEGGKTMDYRIEKSGKKSFIAVVRAFKNEHINDEENHDISDFWTEIKESSVINELYNLRPEGKRDFYGLCAPTKENELTFDYGIGILLDDETLPFEEKQLLAKGYRIWQTVEEYYAVFKCYGGDGSSISETWSKFFQEFLPQSGYDQSEDIDFEIYYEDSEENLFCELWIPVKKVKN